MIDNITTNKISICLLFLGFVGFIHVQAVADEPPTELYVRTVPEGAKVILGGKEVGLTPGLFKTEPGDTKIVVKLEGHDPIEKEVELKASRVTRIELKFKSSSTVLMPKTKNEDLDAALKEVQLNPESPEAQNNLGLALSSAGKFKEAETPYQEALRLKAGKYPEAHNNLGLVLVRQGKMPEAIEHYARALVIKPNYIEAQNNLGFALAQVGRPQEAMGHFQLAIRLKPDYAEAHYNLGLVLSQMGRSEEAVEHYMQALRLKPDYAEAHNNLAKILAQLGQPKEAIDHFKRAIALKPDFDDAYMNLSMAYAMTNQSDEAVKTAEKALELARSTDQKTKVKQIENWLDTYRKAQLEKGNVFKMSIEANDIVIEGVGWGLFRVGVSREELIKAIGPPDPNPNPQNQWVRWSSKYHIDCLFDERRGAYEIRFNKGFEFPLTSGVKIGSPEKDVLMAYGAPDRVVKKPQSKMLEYGDRGILMWIVDGMVFDFTVIKARKLGEQESAQTPSTSNLAPNVSDSKVVEGVGWGAFKVGATREELIKALGEPEPNLKPNNPWVPWLSHYHVDCLLSEHNGATAIQFNEGFEFPLTSGIKIGSPEKDVIAAYGKPEQVVPKGPAKQFQYSTRGVFLYVMNGKVSSFMVVKPVNLETQALNILKNPDIETGNDSPDDWDQGQEIPGVVYSWDKNIGFKSKASLCIEKTAKRYFPIAEWSQIVERQGDLPALQVSAQVKAQKMTKAILDVVFLAENGTWISHNWVAFIGIKETGDKPADHDWKKYSGKVNIPPNTKNISIGLQVYGPGKVWFDDVKASYADNSKPEAAESAQPETDSHEKEIADLLQVLEQNPVDAETHNKLGDLLSKAGRLPEAIVHFRKALMLKPDNAEAQNNLGQALIKMNRSQEGIEHYKQALRLKPDYAEAFYNLAVALEKAAKPEDAKAAALKALELAKSQGQTELADKIEIWLNTSARFRTEINSSSDNATDASDKVIEGVGWGLFRVGVSREELIKAIGPPDPNPNPQNQWVRWSSKYHIDCLLDERRGAYEIRFNEGFELPLISGVKIGSSEKDVLLAYGAPDRVVNKPQSKMLEYRNRGVLMWIVNGKVFDFTVFKPDKNIVQPVY